MLQSAPLPLPSSVVNALYQCVSASMHPVPIFTVDTVTAVGGLPVLDICRAYCILCHIGPLVRSHHPMRRWGDEVVRFPLHSEELSRVSVMLHSQPNHRFSPGKHTQAGARAVGNMNSFRSGWGSAQAGKTRRVEGAGSVQITASEM